MKFQKNNIVKILEKGGVTEIKIQIQQRMDSRKIVDKLIAKLRGYIGEDMECDPDGEHKQMVIELLVELVENGICFIGTCPECSSSSTNLSMFFQGKNDDPFPFLKRGCDSGSLKDTLEKLCRFLLDIPGNDPPLLRKVTTGKHSNMHQLTTKTEQNSGKKTSYSVF